VIFALGLTIGLESLGVNLSRLSVDTHCRFSKATTCHRSLWYQRTFSPPSCSYLCAYARR
jgi:hypothetical protein